MRRVLHLCRDPDSAPLAHRASKPGDLMIYIDHRPSTPAPPGTDTRIWLVRPADATASVSHAATRDIDARALAELLFEYDHVITW
jgi:hypothetical protein